MWNSINERLLDRLTSAASSATDSVVLIAPFMTRRAFNVVLGCINPGVSLIVVTRWNYLDIAAGVSDPNIWIDVKDRPNTSMFLSQRLHAKYYRFDSAVMVGSANITRPGIQVNRPYNIEILTEIAWESKSVRFEDELIADAVEVDESLYLDALKIMNEVRLPHEDVEEDLAEDVDTDLHSVWIPFLRNPSSLWLAYSEQFDLMTTSEREHADIDLSLWSLPNNLNVETFEQVIRSELLHMPLMSKIDRFLDQPQRFGAVRDLISREFDRFNYVREATEAWQSGMRWLLYFFPDRYDRSVPRRSEIMVKRQIGSVRTQRAP